MSEFENFACKMLKYVKKLDPSYKVPETLLKYVPDKWVLNSLILTST